jgi:integrase
MELEVAQHVGAEGYERTAERNGQRKPDGTPLHAHNIVRRDFRKVSEKAGVTRIRFHDLRHSMATWHLQHGTPSKIVQEMLGHSTISMTLDTYSHVLPGMQRKATDQMQARLFGTSGR